MKSKNFNSVITYTVFSATLAIVAAVVFLLLENYVNTFANSTIEFSCDGGFYDEEIDVELSVGKNYFLTYTLDGTKPTATSARYSKPIHISDSSKNDNVYSSNMYTSALYFEDFYDYSIPSKNVDKCTVLRVCAFDKNGEQVSEAIQDYFVGFEDKKGYDGLYTVCVSTDPENLFDEDTGIYVLGKDIQGRIESGELKNYDWYHDWDVQMGANWFADGLESERIASVEIFDPDNNKVIGTNCGLRVRGHGSRNFPQKSLGLYAREEYSGGRGGKFSYDFFGDGNEPRKLVLSDGGDDCDTKITDYLIYSILNNGDNTFPVFDLVPCSVFLNGEYWGPMYIVRDLDNDYIANEYGVTSDNVRLLKAGEMKGDELIAARSTDAQEWESLVNFILENDMSVQQNYDYVCSCMDIEDFAEYAATEVYIGNIDWYPSANLACWRTVKSEKGNPYSDGKWRFCLYDVNWSMISQDEVWDNLVDWSAYQMVQNLGQNEDFKKLFKKKIKELEELFSEENVDVAIEEWQRIMGEPTKCYYERFASDADADEKIQEKIDGVVEFCKNRPEDMKELYENFFE